MWSMIDYSYYGETKIWDKWLLSKQTINRFDHSIHPYYHFYHLYHDKDNKIPHKHNFYISSCTLILPLWFTLLYIIYRSPNYILPYSNNLKLCRFLSLWISFFIWKIEDYFLFLRIFWVIKYCNPQNNQEGNLSHIIGTEIWPFTKK